MTKRCNKCGQEHPLDHFHRNKAAKDGHINTCKDCAKAYDDQRAENRREDRKAYFKRPDIRARETVRARQPKYAENNRNWQQEHPQQRRQTERKWRQANPDKVSAQQTRKRAKHADTLKLSKQAYYNDRGGREKTAAYRARRRAERRHYEASRDALIKASSTHFTKAEWQHLKTLYGFECLSCHRKEPDIRLSPDHVIPLCKGGTNDVSNIQPLCMPCNQSKHTNTTDYRPHVIR